MFVRKSRFYLPAVIMGCLLPAIMFVIGGLALVDAESSNGALARTEPVVLDQSDPDDRGYRFLCWFLRTPVI